MAKAVPIAGPLGRRCLRRWSGDPRDRASVAWPGRAGAMDGRARGCPAALLGFAPFAGLIPGADGSGVRRPVRSRGRPPDRAHLPLARSSPRSFSPGDRRPRAMRRGRRRASGLPVAVDGRGRAGLGSWALPPRPVRSASPAVLRRGRPILPWASILSQVSQTPGAPRPPITGRSRTSDGAPARAASPCRPPAPGTAPGPDPLMGLRRSADVAGGEAIAGVRRCRKVIPRHRRGASHTIDPSAC